MAHGYTPSDHYILNEELDLSESRCTEFRSGAGFIRNDFRNSIGKYACGFLNSHEDGTLMLGIEDSGIVIGYSVTRVEEDSIRLQFDEAMKDISPNVFPKDYSIKFVPVHDNNGNHHYNRYVIEIRVRGSRVVNRDRLYECKLGVFLRRDGSLEGPLRPKQIQEWTHQMFELKMIKMKKVQQNLQEALEKRTSQLKSERLKQGNHQKDQDRLRKLQIKTEDLEDKNESLKARIIQFESSQQNQNQQPDETMKELGEIKHLLSKKTQTKVCAIM